VNKPVRNSVVKEYLTTAAFEKPGGFMIPDLRDRDETAAGDLRIELSRFPLLLEDNRVPYRPEFSLSPSAPSAVFKGIAQRHQPSRRCGAQL